MVAGFVGAPFVSGGFKSWVHFGAVEHEPFSYALAVLSVEVGLAGVAIGYRLYATYREREPLTALGPGYTLLVNKYYLDDLYMKGIIRPIQYGISRWVNWTNQNILDGAVNAAAWLTRKLSLGVDEVDRKVVDGAVNGTGILTKLAGTGLRLIQSGDVQSYAALLFAGTVILAIGITRSLVGLLIALGVFLVGLIWAIFRMTRREERA